jgi:hypothetical protein
MYGEGSGTENSTSLGYEAEAGQDNYIYVRVRNRGGADANNVIATVYWSEVATLVTPDLWNLIGEVTLPLVLSGDQLTVSDALVWPTAEIPATGHYCLVGLIGSDLDPAPAAADFVDFDNFRRFIRDNNNVTWRNFNVVDNLPDPPSASTPPNLKALSFIVPGATDKARKMALEVIARLPVGARLLLEAPTAVAESLRLRGKPGKKRSTLLIPVKCAGRQLIGEAVLPAKSRSRMRLLVEIPKKYRDRAYDVAVRQIYEGEEVGRVTWRLAPPRDRKSGTRRKRKR